MKKAAFNFLAMFMLGLTLVFTGCSIDECKDVVCENGICVLGTCSCDTGYEGTDCSTRWTSAFVASYDGTESCDSSGVFIAGDTYAFSIAESSTEATKLNIDNIYDGGEITTATASSTSAFTIPTQSFGSATISGSGSLASGDVSMAVSIIFSDGTTYDCTLDGARL